MVRVAVATGESHKYISRRYATCLNFKKNPALKRRTKFNQPLRGEE